MAMAEEKESTSIPLSQAENGSTDPEDPAKSPPSSPNSSTRKCIRRMGMLRSWDACLRFRKYCMLFCSPELVLEEVHDWMVLSFGIFRKFSFLFVPCDISRLTMFNMKNCSVVLFPVAVTFFITWWFIQFVDGFFSPLYERLGVDIFGNSICITHGFDFIFAGLGFITSLLFVFFVGVFVSSWMGAAVFSVGEWVIKQMPFVKHIYSASKQISAAISPG
ncbi:hypothetical protein Goklo_004155 [Gossypium klotzschianum]|uniref:Uncharacterized protein n=1 Tax=Gossypium klotzschianum TaxID=34286 RepID=A0A7J8VMR0_9ROSI|nr:hypothetical protein [Gossypium klotzschianum]